MSSFLANMIGRHLGAVEMVQPRLRSVFEPELPAMAARAVESSFPETAAEKASMNTPVDTQATVPGVSIIDAPHPVNPPAQPLPLTVPHPAETAEGSKLAPQNQAGGRESLRHEPRALNAQSSPKYVSWEAFNKTIRPATTTPSEAAHIAGEPVAKATRVGEIEGVIKRLSDQANRLAGVERRLQDRSQAIPGGNDGTAAIPLIEGPDSLDIKAPQPGKVRDESPKTLKPRDITPVSAHSGILQTPQWLDTLRADLSNKWSELNAQLQSEPVINVTIGRVEVRALTPEPAKAHTVEQKPTGVMSLDTYLKRRESKGAT